MKEVIVMKIGQDLWELHCAPLRGYRTTLCTTDLHCAPPTSIIVHHGAQGGPVLTYSLVVCNIALYQLGNAQDDFACPLPTFLMVQCSFSHSGPTNVPHGQIDNINHIIFLVYKYTVGKNVYTLLRVKDTNRLSYANFSFPPEIDQFSKWKSCSGE